MLSLSLPVFEVLCGLSPPLCSQSLGANRQSPLLQSLQLFGDLFALVGQLVSLAGLGPEVGYGEARVQVGAEVVHDADWEHDVHAELDEMSVLRTVWCWSRAHSYLEYLEIRAAHFERFGGCSVE